MENSNNGINKKRLIIMVSVMSLSLLCIFGASYAWFMYRGETGESSFLIAGDISLTMTEGTDNITLLNVIPQTKEEARRSNNNTLTFTVSGTNTTGRSIAYNILLNRGSNVSGKDRFSDDELVFDLVELDANNNETYLVSAQSFNILSDTSIYDNIIASQEENVSHKYRLRLWLNENVIISDTYTGAHAYTTSDYKNRYATVKISVRGETVKGNNYTVTFNADGGTTPIASKKVIVGQNYGNLPTPTKEGYTFLGWNGKNLFNQDTVSINSYINDSGNSVRHTNENQPWSTSDYIPIDGNTTYTFNPNSTLGSSAKHAVYDENKDFIEAYASGPQTITTPANARYIRVSFRGTSENVQLEVGSVSTTYEPYYIRSTTKVVQESNHTLKAIWQANS